MALLNSPDYYWLTRKQGWSIFAAAPFTILIVAPLIGLFLYGAVALAIGMFASALTRYQLAAALGGAFLLFAFSYLFPLARRLDPPMRDVLEQTDLWWIHFQNGFMRGVLNLKDVIFYLAMTYFFLLLGTKTLEAKRWQ